MSVITSIYAAIAAKTVTTTKGVTPTTYDLDELKNSVDTAITPCRLLLPIGDDTPGDGREGAFVAIGTSMTIVWQINDLMLLKPTEQGLGLKDFAYELVDYCGKYLDAMRDLKCPVANTSLESVRMLPGIYEWPMGSGRNYSGVLCQLSIREHLHG